MKESCARSRAAAAVAIAVLIASRIPAADCNRDGRPDAEELASGASPDCNANGLPDECDVALFRPDGPAPFRLDINLGSIAPADLDGDGKDDVAMAMVGDPAGTVSIFRSGEVLGTWYAAARPIAGSAPRPQSLLSSDLDGDGDLDLAVPGHDTSTGSVWTLHNEGTAAWTSRAQPFLLEVPVLTIAADLEADGDVDLAVLEWSRGSFLHVGRNDGRGSFAVSARQALPAETFFMAEADVDGDGDLDLTIASSRPPAQADTVILVLANEREAGFTPAGTFPGPGSLSALTAGDVDGDGVADLFLGTAAGPIRFELYRGLGGGAFAEPRRIEAPLPHRALSRLDGDGDGDIDFVFLGHQLFGDGEILFLLENRGAGEFASPLALDAVAAAFLAAPADPDGDGDPDLLLGDWNTASFWALENLGGTFGKGSGLISETPPSQLVAGDFNGDEDPDFAAASPFPPGISVILRGGAAPRTAVQTPLSFPPAGIAAADLDGDGDRDLAAAGSFSAAWLRNDGQGAFVLAPELIRVGSNPVALEVADVNGDGDLDLVTANTLFSGLEDNVSVIENQGGGAFANPRNFAAGVFPADLAAADVDGDGDPDLVIANHGPTLEVLWNGGRGSFLDRATLPASGRNSVQQVLSFEADGDGALDLIVWGSEGFAVFRNRGRGAFHPPQTAGLDASYWDFQLEASAAITADVDRDGDADLVVHARDTVRIAWNAAGTLGPPQTAAKARRPAEGEGGSSDPPEMSLAAGDFDRDGDPDLALAISVRNAIRILYNRAEESSRDLDHDGVPDECQPRPVRFRRGDVDADSLLNLSDAVVILRHLFAGGGLFPCEAAGDADQSGALDLADAIAILNHLFLGGSAPAPPFPDCGLDPLPDGLPCRAFPPCADSLPG